MCNCHQKYELRPEFEFYPNFEFDYEGPQTSSGTRDSREYIIWVQRSLNRILRLRTPLPTDGILNPRTRQAIRLFQRSRRIPDTGTVDDATESALQKGSGTSAPVHTAATPTDCQNGVNITTEFKKFIGQAKALVAKITKPPLTKRITDEIDDIIGPEPPVDFPTYDIFVCSKIVSILAIGQTIDAEVVPSLKAVFLSQKTWDLHDEFLQTGDLSVLIKFFQTIAHEKRHATLGSTVEVKPSAIQKGPDQQLADVAGYHAQEILVKAEEIAVAKTMDPTYKVPVSEQQLFRKNWNIVLGLVTQAEQKRLRSLIIQLLRNRYFGGKGCDSALTLGVLSSMETGQWFLCDRGTGLVQGTTPNGLTICKRKNGTHQVC
jgi:peptidoglycan hydrolase-like protein with peptidoglycan-binding domain